MDSQVVFGDLFRKRRKALGLTLREFCRRNGYDPGNISRLERAKTPPPADEALVRQYAKALKLEPQSDEWHCFVQTAAMEAGRIPGDLGASAQGRQELRRLMGRLGRPPRSSRNRVSSVDLECWADHLEARSMLPRLVRRLVHGTVDDLRQIDFPAGEASQRHGWDGVTFAKGGNVFVPGGTGGWEMGVGVDPRQKAEADFGNRRRDPVGLDPAETTFIFVTPRKWDMKQQWCQEKRRLKVWKEVRVYDSSSLEEWLEIAPAVDTWFGRTLGFSPGGTRDLDDYWASLASISDPALTPQVFLNSRDEEMEVVKAWLQGPPSALAFETDSPMEMIDSLAAHFAGLPESDREASSARALIVWDREAFESLSDSRNSLILIALPSLALQPEMVSAAVRKGHRVAISSQRVVTGAIAKPWRPRTSRFELAHALRDSGLEERRAHELAWKSGGSLTVLKRLISRFPSTASPAWTRAPGAGDLVPILLAGAWDGTCEADQKVMARIAGRPYERVLAVASRWITGEDPPITRAGARWSLLSRDDSWHQLAPSITSAHLDIFEKVAVEVLEEDDPRLDVPAGDHWGVLIEGKLPRYSSTLRAGMAETVALLGAHPASASIRDAVGSTHRAERILRQLLLDGADWRRWASLDDHLPQLAEAAPEVFLEAVDTDLRRSTPQVPLLFGKRAEAILTSCLHTGLLWALETLAWTPKFLTHTSLTLARLAEVDPGGGWANRPINSLRDIFAPWSPQTCASLEQRVQALRTVLKRCPDAGWRLLPELLRKVLGASSYTRRPRWRDWAAEWKYPDTLTDCWRQIQATADLLLAAAERDTSRYCQLVESCEGLPPEGQKRLLEKLDQLDPGSWGTDEKRKIADKLREVINNPRRFQRDQLARPVGTLDVLERVLGRFEPDDRVARNAWLFSRRPPVVGSEEDTWQSGQAALVELRQRALAEILAKDGFPGVLEFAEAIENPAAVGEALGGTQLMADDAEILPGLLLHRSDKIREFVQAYVYSRLREEGWDWVMARPLQGWSALHAGRFALALPRSREVWNMVEKLGGDAEQIYWREVSGFWAPLTSEDLEYAVSKLLHYDRPLQAVDVLGTALMSGSSIESSFAMRALEGGLKSGTPRKGDDWTGRVVHEIQAVFNHFHSQHDIDSERLASLEWGYLEVLDGHGAGPKTLLELLGSKPDFFARLLCMAYKSRRESTGQDEEPTEEQVARALRASSVLRSWRTIPGSNADGTIDETKLLEWVREARRLCEESGHLEVCDTKIGEVLAHSQDEPDGTWPCVAVRDLMEELESENMMNGFVIGILRKRAVWTKSPLEGGKQERELADKYGTYARACQIEWPRTAAAMRRVAKEYEDQARREDERARDNL